MLKLAVTGKGRCGCIGIAIVEPPAEPVSQEDALDQHRIPNSSHFCEISGCSQILATHKAENNYTGKALRDWEQRGSATVGGHLLRKGSRPPKMATLLCSIVVLVWLRTSIPFGLSAFVRRLPAGKRTETVQSHCVLGWPMMSMLRGTHGSEAYPEAYHRRCCC